MLTQRSNSSSYNWPHHVMLLPSLPAKRIISEQSYNSGTGKHHHNRSQRKKVQLQLFWLSKYIINYKYAERYIFICLFFKSFSTRSAALQPQGARKCILTWSCLSGLVILISGFECLRFVWFGKEKLSHF